jgi:L-lactate dehydrogenase (cytochrome)
VPLEVLPSIVAAVRERGAVMIDGGVLHGQDVVAAVAFGADAVLVGRAYLYGLMAGGQAGVQKAYDLLRAEVVRTMQLMGVASVAELTADRVRLRP